MPIYFRIRIFVYLGIFQFAQPAVLASDLVPPSWRGDPGTTYQQWLFEFDRSTYNTTGSSVCAETSANKTPWGQRSPPEYIDNPYQQATGICAEFKSLWPIAQNIDWLKNYNNREGVWKLEGERTFTNFLNFIVPNASAKENAKTTIQIQIAYQSPDGNPPINIYTQSRGLPPDTEPLSQDIRFDEVRLPEDWIHHTAMIMVDKCPEIISIMIFPPQKGIIFIDTITIDTLCENHSGL